MSRNIFLCAMLMTVPAFAQMKVCNNGNVMIGNGTTATTSSPLSLGTTGGSNYMLHIGTNSTQYSGIFIDQNNTSTVNNNSGIYVRTRNSSNIGAKAYGIQIKNEASNTALNVGLFSSMTGTSGNKFAVSGSIKSGSGAAILGTVGNISTENSINHSGAFAGYFKGDVLSTGNFYGTLLSNYPTFPSLQTANPAEDGYGESESFSDRLSRLSILTYSAGEAESDYAPTRVSKSDTRYALDLETLREVFPEFVYEDADGNVSVDYVGMVPVLVQSLVELRQQFELFKEGEIEKREPMREQGNTAAIDNATARQKVSLSQNIPNPFSGITVIDLTVPEEIESASLMICDMNGRLLKELNIAERGNIKVNLNAADFYKGIFLYTLVTDGKMAATKRMSIK